MVELNYFPKNKSKIFFVGIKGTGMAALAALLKTKDYFVYGSDVGEPFFTDLILSKYNIDFDVDFSIDALDDTYDFVIYSAAYDVDSHPQLLKASELKIPMAVYPQALGLLSKESYFVGVAGIHGKTTTTALIGTLIKNTPLQASVLAGSIVSQFDNSPVLTQGEELFVAETCEYRRHFLFFDPNVVLITSLEEDHLDYFKDLDDIKDAFLSYCQKIPKGGSVIYYGDSQNVISFIESLSSLRPDLRLIPYGYSCNSLYTITSTEFESGQFTFQLVNFNKLWTLAVPGRHNILNATAALAVITELYKYKELKIESSTLDSWHNSLISFKGTKRRSEVIGEACGILFMDDYGHHPTALKTTIEGVREFYPDRRIVVDFMSHTYSRTISLFDEFAQAFSSADVVILHKIYASARETQGTIRGQDLYHKTKEYHNSVYYEEEPLESIKLVTDILKSGDLFLTMGAGNNWELGQALYKLYSSKESIN
ncbi:UDP-N-acetylmuramate--L-alanine ligase [Spirochaeta cellobiosiphila]|uniref:UDP-N-acetylmuramate--L-alanine ligase n=1 Tax=Spirochaeta cellobiosiphila TaxID=504483 RepID=UPI0004065F29|nr:UDP-N-acetylmuramate--L-alanine ligase [Spirochaeta cellobiosiphila]